MNQQIAAWQDNILSPVDKLEVHKRGLKHPAVSVFVKRNNEITVKNLENFNPDKIIISPGPGSPDKKEYFGNCQDIILKLGKSIPILGICLGMQGIVHSFGGKIIHAKEPMHGKISFLLHDEKGIYEKIPQNIEIMRYHSFGS